MNPAVDAGILRLAELGRLNATSCLVEGPSFAAGAQPLSKSGLQLGLHLNFTESLQQAGLYFPVSSLIMRTWLRRLDALAVARQIARQLEDRKSTRLNSSHVRISYAVFCLKKKS